MGNICINKQNKKNLNKDIKENDKIKNDEKTVLELKSNQWGTDNDHIDFLDNSIIIGTKNKKNLFQIINNTTYKLKNKNLKNINLLRFMSVLTVNNHTIYIFGGINDKKKISNKSYCLSSSLYATEIPDMIYHRYSFPSILKDNYVYVIGGKGNKNNNDSLSLLSNCEKLNLRTLVWEPIANLNKTRLTSSALIFNNKIYVFGGFSENVINKRTPKIERYNEKLNIWEVLDFKLYFGIEWNTSFITHQDNKILLFGGKNKKCVDYNIYEIDLFNETILTKGHLLEKRVLNHLIYNKSKDEVLIIGSSNATKLKNEIFNLKNFTSSPNNIKIDHDKSYQCSKETINVNYNEDILIHKLSKNDFNDYNIVVGNDRNPFILLIHKNKDATITLPVPLNIKLYNYQGIIRVKPHKLFLCGGLTINNLKVTPKAYMLNLFKMKGKRLENMPNCKYTFSTVFLNNYVYTLGGRTYGNDNEAILNECSKYNLRTKNWENMPNLKKKRCSNNSFIYKNEIYLAGGYTGSNNNKRSSEIEKYCPETNKWYMLGISLIKPLEASLCFKYNKDEIFFIGGRDLRDDTVDIINFDLKKDNYDLQNFSQFKSLKNSRCLSNCFIFKNNIVVFGGNDNFQKNYILEEINIKNKAINIIKLPNITTEIKKNFYENELFKKCSFSPIFNDNEFTH